MFLTKVQNNKNFTLEPFGNKNVNSYGLKNIIEKYTNKKHNNIYELKDSIQKTLINNIIKYKQTYINKNNSNDQNEIVSNSLKIDFNNLKNIYNNDINKIDNSKTSTYKYQFMRNNPLSSLMKPNGYHPVYGSINGYSKSFVCL